MSNDLNRTNLLAAIRSGLIFGVTFIKKDGTKRKMQCMTGVTKHLTGGAKSGCDIKNDLVTVWSLDAEGYRRFRVQSVIQLRIDGAVYDFDPTIGEV